LFEFTLPDFYPFISLIFWKLISSRLFYISIGYLFCYGGFSLNVQLHPNYYTQALEIFEEIKSPYADWVRGKIAELEAEKE